MTLAAVPRYDARRARTLGDRAVVVGGSVAGLVAARVLADYFRTVTVLEADEYPPEPGTRRGVPQGSQIHALQEAGRATLEDLLPGYGEALLAAGALQIDGASDIEFFTEGAFLADGSRRLPGYTASRPLFEDVARRRVAAVDGVELRTGCRVTDYSLAGESTDSKAGVETRTVDGVQFRDGAGGKRRLEADLVVDASGRTSKTPDWLERNGFDVPPVADVEIDVGYSTVAVERPPGDRQAVLAVADAPRVRGGAAFPVEGDRWLVNVHGVHGDHPPTDLDGMRAFAGTLPVEHVQRFLRENRVVGDVEYYPFPSNRRRYYERVDRFPAGFVVVGDAMASFNPVYGQGMSVATLEGLQLHHSLAGGLDRLAARYFDRAASLVDTAWAMAVGADAQFAETTGPTPRGADLFARYLSRLQRRAHTDPDLRVALMRVISMELPPTSLFRPRTLARVLAPTWLKTGSGRGPALSPVDSGRASSTYTADRLPGIDAEDRET